MAAAREAQIPEKSRPAKSPAAPQNVRSDQPESAKEASAGSQEAFLRYLLKQGDIPSVPVGRPGPPPLLVPVRGEPVSETIIRERG